MCHRSIKVIATVPPVLQRRTYKRTTYLFLHSSFITRTLRRGDCSARVTTVARQNPAKFLAGNADTKLHGRKKNHNTVSLHVVGAPTGTSRDRTAAPTAVALTPFGDSSRKPGSAHWRPPASCAPVLPVMFVKINPGSLSKNPDMVK